MWNWFGILSGTLFLMASPEVIKDDAGNMTTIFDEKIECSTLSQLKYCHIYSEKDSSEDVIYFFHGVLHNEKSWIYQRKNFEFRKLMFESKKSRPHIISVSIGSFGLIKQTAPSTQTIFEDLLKIEASLMLVPKRRYLYGKSLGAFNALQLGFASLQNQTKFKVDKIALGCPFIPELDPFIHPENQLSYALENGLNPLRFLILQAYQRWKFNNSKDWSDSSPLSLLDSKELALFPPVFIVVGKDDEFYFSSSARLFMDLAATKNLNVNFKEIPGNHCVVDNQEIINFLGL